MARGGIARRGDLSRRQGRQLTLVHNPSRRRVLPGPLTPEFGASGEGCISLLSWHDFLEAECRRPGGLLCFYDRPMTTRVAAVSRFFALWVGVLQEVRAAKGRSVSR